MIHRDGHREVFYMTVLMLAWAVALGVTLVKASDWWWLATIPLVVVWCWGVLFFRDPERQTPEGAGLFISPADGVVADITPLGPDSALGRDGVQIGVFMNIFNVHVNRIPCDAVVEWIEHEPGLFMDVRDPAAAERNESSTMKMIHHHDGQSFPVLVRQVAGMLAQRIVNNARPAEPLKRGQRFGLIKYGSRVELLLPTELAGKICVEVGQPVKAGLTVLAKIESEDV